MKTAHDLVDEPLLSWRGADRRRGQATLPGILARLASGELRDFPRVRAHQFHPWCMFLTQLAAIALHHAKKTDPRLSEKSWRSLLLELTNDAHEPWCLVVEDLKAPAFFQPPVPEGEINEWPICDSPDDLDILVTTKAHDVKRHLLRDDDYEGWTYALTTLQTTQGVFGSGKYGIARMKSGYGSRPRVGLASDRSLTARFTRDVRVLLDSWDTLLERGFNSDGFALAWLAPWNGKSSLTMPELSPHFIEVCRRVRCLVKGNRTCCAFTTTTMRRCLPEVENGDVGDPWVPIERAKGALTVGRRGFDYELVTRLLFEGDFEPAATQTIRAGDADPMLFVASVMARGQGKTEGLHERTLLISSALRKRLGQVDARAAVGKRASENVQQAKKMGESVLAPAVAKLALGTRAAKDFRTNAWKTFDASVDNVFFDDLLASLEQTDEEAQLAWGRRLNEIAWAELQRSIERCSVPSARWYQAVSEAEGVFRDRLNKQFPTLVASREAAAARGTA